jgi:hypothetical protein
MDQSLLSNNGWDDAIPPPEKPGYLALSRTTDRVLQILLAATSLACVLIPSQNHWA